MKRASLVLFGLLACSDAQKPPARGADDNATAIDGIDEDVEEFHFEPGYDLGPAKKLRVMYAGATDLDRGQAFLGLLRAGFSQVDAIDLKSLNASAAASYDVVVADWKRRWGPDGVIIDYDWPELHLGFEFTKPVVLIASGGRSIQQHTKFESY